ncbi:unnamed protein product, partial [Mesorhabditis spiculigera]
MWYFAAVAVTAFLGGTIYACVFLSIVYENVGRFHIQKNPARPAESRRTRLLRLQFATVFFLQTLGLFLFIIGPFGFIFLVTMMFQFRARSYSRGLELFWALGGLAPLYVSAHSIMNNLIIILVTKSYREHIFRVFRRYKPRIISVEVSNTG